MMEKHRTVPEAWKIPLTIPITGMQRPMLRLIQEQQKKGDGAEMKETPGNSCDLGFRSWRIE